MIITVGNTKGGVGKTTIAVNLAVEAAKRGQTVLVVDTDPQGSAIDFRKERTSDDINVMALVSDKIHKDIQKFTTAFDLIIIDAGGRDNDIFRSAVAACELFLLPVLPSQFDVWAAVDAIKAFREIQPFNNMAGRIVLNQIQPKTVVSGEAQDSLVEHEDILPLLPQRLHHRVAYKTSISNGQGVSEYEPAGKAAEEMKALYLALININK